MPKTNDFPLGDKNGGGDTMGVCDASSSSSMVPVPTERERWEQERELTIDFFHLVNGSNNTRQLLDAATTFFQQHSHCEAVAIRLREHNNFPYFQSLGFSQKFLLSENILGAEECLGTRLHDPMRSATLPCRCGDVICGRFDPSKPYFTPQGSFWTNSTTELQLLAAQEEPQTSPHGRCTSEVEVYESVALIPLKAGDERLGLLRFNDKRQQMFSPEAIALWERLAAHLSVALVKSQAEETLRASDAQFRSIFESLDEGLVVADSHGRILHWNPASLKMHGFPDSTDGRLMLGEFTRIFELSTLDGRVLSLDEWPISRILRGERLHQKEYRVRRLDRDDWNRSFSYGGTTFFDSDGKTVLAVLTLSDITERKRAEETLRQSEERARVLFDRVSDALLVREIEPDGGTGHFLEVNDVACKRLGYSREEMLSMSPVDIDDPASGVSAAEIGTRFANKPIAIFDQIHVAKDGRRIPVEIHSHRLNLCGKPTVISSVRDMSERKRAERALRESEQRLTQAVGLAGMGIFEHDHIAESYHCSQIFRTMFGLGEEKVTSDAIMERVFPEDRAAVAAAICRSHNPLDAAQFRLEHRIVRPDGIRWVLVRGETFFEGEADARHAVRTVGAIVDVTYRKDAERELLESQQQLRTAIDAANLGVWSTDLETGIISGDVLARSIYHWTEDEVVTTGMMLSCIVPEDREQLKERQAALANGLAANGAGIEYRIQLPDASIRWVYARGTLVRDSSGKPARLSGVVQDITERKQAEAEKLALEQQFLHAQKMEAVGRLAGGIAHDFNNLLMVIRSYTEMMQDSLPAHDPLRKNTQAVMKAADRAASLTGQMLAFSRKQVLSPVALNLNAAVAESAKMLQRLIGEDVELQMTPAESTWVVRADPDQIAQVLMNLSVNARDAMPEGGTLTIATRNFTADGSFIAKHPYFLPGDYAVFSVADTGTGISKEVEQQMFEPFFTTKSVGKGTGLGLSTVFGIVKQSGGYLLVDSELGRGSCFTIYLPRVAGAVAPSEMFKAEWLQHGTETLLVVEDEDALRESIGEFLGALGYKILSAESGHRALTIAAQFEQSIDLMITDVVMPRMSGRELSQMLGSLRPELKTIFMSGYTDDAVVRHGVQEEGVAFLQKPFSLATLSRKVRDILGKDSRHI